MRECARVRARREAARNHGQEGAGDRKTPGGQAEYTLPQKLSHGGSVALGDSPAKHFLHGFGLSFVDGRGL